jgi:outer membrane immunogenic protein
LPRTTRRRPIGTSSGARSRAKIRSPATPGHYI